MEECAHKGPWVVQSAKRPTLGLGSGHDLMASWVQAPHRALCWHCGVCLGFSLSPSLCLPPTHTVSVSLKIDKLERKKERKRRKEGRRKKERKAPSWQSLPTFPSQPSLIASGYTSHIHTLRSPLLQKCPLRQEVLTPPSRAWQVPSRRPPRSLLPSPSFPAHISRPIRKQLRTRRKSESTKELTPTRATRPAPSFPLPPALLPRRSQRHVPASPVQSGPLSPCLSCHCAFAQEDSPLSRRPGRPSTRCSRPALASLLQEASPHPPGDAALLRPLQLFANIASGLLSMHVPQ